MMFRNRHRYVLVVSSAVAACSGDGAPANPPGAMGGSGGTNQDSGSTDVSTTGTGGNAGRGGGPMTTGDAAGAGGNGTAGRGMGGAAGAGMGGAAGGGMGGAAGAGMDGAARDANSTDGSAGASVDAGTGDSSQMDAAIDVDARPSGGCSEPIRIGPMPGKEGFTVNTPADMRFPFTKHWVGIFSDDPRYVGMESLTDIDNDGDLDYAHGQRSDQPGGMVWYEYCGPDQWVRHALGGGHRSTAGGGAMDVNADGFVDLVASNSWYRNPGGSTAAVRAATTWERFTINDLDVEENIIGDVNHDKKPDLLYFMTGINPQWWTPGPGDPTLRWTTGKVIGTHPSRQGGAVGDIDGDGKNDVLGGRDWWYRNVDGVGMTWEEVAIPAASGFTAEPLTYLGDLDGDGDTDLAMITHWGGDTGARAAWFENVDGMGRNFALHSLKTGLGWLHTVVAADFDNDGDLDIYVGKNAGPQWIWENTDGKGTFVEHTVAADFRGHDARVGDVDCDGDLDVVGSPWGDQNEGGEAARPPRDVVYLQNMLVERGGTPLFDRPKEMTFHKEPPCVCRR
ncbi:MAG TPA: VCBS repeat-containing protein [Polyangiaceae bacterium]|nr:VCBS repeat-containing protein [Polyangiaceae bacterium]